MSVDETGHYDSIAGVNDIAIHSNRLFDLALSAGLNDASIAYEHRAAAYDRQFSHLRPNSRAPRPGQRYKLGGSNDGQ